MSSLISGPFNSRGSRQASPSLPSMSTGGVGGGGVVGGDALPSATITPAATTTTYQAEDFLNIPNDMAQMLEAEMNEILHGGGLGSAFGPPGSQLDADSTAPFFMRLDTPGPDELPSLDSFDPLNFGVNLESDFEGKYASLLSGEAPNLSSDTFCGRMSSSVVVDRATLTTSPFSSFLFDSNSQPGSVGSTGSGINRNPILMVDPQTGIPNQPMVPTTVSQNDDNDSSKLWSETTTTRTVSSSSLSFATRPSIAAPHLPFPAPATQSGAVAAAASQCDRDVHMMSPPPTKPFVKSEATFAGENSKSSEARVAQSAAAQNVPVKSEESSQVWSQLQTILLSGTNGPISSSLLQQLQPLLSQQKSKNIIVQAKALTPTSSSESATRATPPAANGPTSFQTVQILKSGAPGSVNGTKTVVFRGGDVPKAPASVGTPQGAFSTPTTMAAAPTTPFGTAVSSAAQGANRNGAALSSSAASYPNLSSPSEARSGCSVSSENSDEDSQEVGHTDGESDNPFPKPVYSYSCLIALALKNSKTGSLPVSDIYNFMTDNFPYFRTAPDGWKNSVRHNLSLNKCFEKIEKPGANGQGSRKGCHWSLNPLKLEKMEDEIIKWRKKDPQGVLRSMSYPEKLESIERGTITSSNYSEFSHLRDPRLLFETHSDEPESQSVPSQVPSVSYPAKQMVKMSDLGTALQKDAIKKDRDISTIDVSVRHEVPPTQLTTTGNILASLSGIAGGSNSIKFSFSPGTNRGKSLSHLTSILSNQT